MSSTPSRSPDSPTLRHVVIVGAGMVGLATAWFLQEYGVEVTVVDRDGVAAGASWGNAGWLCPGLVTPIAEPSVLRYGLKSLFIQLLHSMSHSRSTPDCGDSWHALHCGAQ